MKKPDIPQNESCRLQTLQSLGILDTLPEQRFDRLTRMAKRMFSVPIALVSLIDENRQWFKSSVGLNVSETGRDISFCGHTILGNDIFIIPNAVEDERFADNPLVLNEPSIRFYAGCPLRAPNGDKMGTLCIIDREPRNFNEDDLEALRDLALMVEHEMAATQLATIDELTNILNRRGFMILAQHTLRLCARQHVPVSLVFLDLDKFKLVNDLFGHAEGDRALIDFADQMKVSFRDSDIFARLGGDEFVILLVDSTKSRAEMVVSRFRKSLEKLNRRVNRGYDILFSHGIVEFNPKSENTLESYLADSDSIMYKNKKIKKIEPVKNSDASILKSSQDFAPIEAENVFRL